MHKYRKVDNVAGPNRVLLTEVAPFELPPNLGNQGFHRIVQNAEISVSERTLIWREGKGTLLLVLVLAGISDSVKVKASGDQRELQLKPRWRTPYRFSVRKNDGQRRALSLPHPLSQLDMVEFYRAHSGAMIFHATKSNYSLRHPIARSRFSYVEDRLHKSRRHSRVRGLEIAEDEVEHFVSYFRYSRFPNINKFYESRLFHAMEARFAHQRRLDITRCFESLYTHSVDWAVRGHYASKRGINDSNFSSDLDRLFSDANNGQTNGVLVGPEFSRIFAEIILQRIDQEVETKLAARGLELGLHYWVGRYVDDYFIFCSSEVMAAEIQDLIESELEKFNLRFNKAKQLDFTGPSHSPIHTAKQAIAKRFSEYFDRAFSYAEKGTKKGSQPDVNKLISAFKAVLHGEGVAPAEVGNFTLGVVEKRIRKLRGKIANLRRDQAEAATSVMRDVTKLVEFVYLASSSVPTAIRASRTLLLLTGMMRDESFDRDLQLALRGELDRVTVDVLARSVRDDAGAVGAERYYWLLLHAELGRALLLTAEEVRRFVALDEKSKPMDYLGIVTSLLYMRGRSRYSALRTEIEVIAEERVEFLHPDSAERAMLQADLLACPYIEAGKKRSWLTSWFPNEAAADIQDAMDVWPENVFTKWEGFDLSAALNSKRRREVY